ncbi:hypothetical protein NVB75_01560 [Pseudomonas sp. CBS]|uniref:hypothetical protein n=1 Tax=Pseudomonas TaxID=286 RepID=UPI0021ACB429|nr:hypothetical protein [Pseudomonas sp. CBS]UVH51593.1 hypothetical protein NVB75_01560 [Pseudomonas sp. CBS]WEL75330.1 hypothetical protein P0D92_25105 [Pseudomonas sp. CBSPAW29]WEL80429.1 hypothetical protein P0D95_20695 [Pseudomonas sp. CBSPCAW29]WEL88943.1 hypothetical protein P0D90_02960 [Pseudomonas sp. CBSPCBW29]
MISWKQFFLVLSLSVLAFVLFVCSIAGAVENPNDLSDTLGIPAAFMFAVMLMCVGLFSLVVSLVSLIVCRVIGEFRLRTRFFVSFIANVPLLLTYAFGFFSVAVFSYDSLVGVLSGLLFASVFCCVCVGLFQVAKLRTELV